MKQNGIKAYVDGKKPDRIIDVKENEVTLVYNFGILGEGKELNFVDVPKGEYYYDAVMWAVGTDITNGTSDTTVITFSPDTICTRAQVVTFLYRLSTFNK